MMKIIALCLFVFVSTCTGTYQNGNNAQKIITTPEQGEAWCEMCVIVADRVGVLIKEKDQQGKVNETLFSLCDVLSGFVRAQCYIMVPKIESQISKGIDSEKICHTLRFCGGGNAPEYIMTLASRVQAKKSNLWEEASQMLKTVVPQVEKTFDQYSDASVKSGSVVTCLMCKALVSIFDRSLVKYQKPILDFVIGICNDLPSPTNKACSDAMDYYIPHWWDEFFRTVASADNICDKLHLCDDDYRLHP